MARGAAGCFGLLTFPMLTLWRGFALAMIWNWFPARVFGLPTIGVVSAMGCALLADFFYLIRVKDVQRANDGTAKQWWTVQFARWAQPAFALGMGWVLMRWV